MLPEVHSNDDFISFLKWMQSRGAFASTIIDIVESPHNYGQEYSEFMEEVYG